MAQGQFMLTKPIPTVGLTRMMQRQFVPDEPIRTRMMQRQFKKDKPIPISITTNMMQNQYNTFMEQDQFNKSEISNIHTDMMRDQFVDVPSVTISKHQYITERDKKKAEDDTKWKKEKESWGPEMYRTLMGQRQFDKTRNRPTKNN